MPKTKHRDRRRLVEKYGWSCYYCGRELFPQNATIDHKVPLSRGGTEKIGNKVLACKRCNGKKKSMDEKEFLRSMGFARRERSLRDRATDNAMLPTHKTFLT